MKQLNQTFDCYKMYQNKFESYKIETYIIQVKDGIDKNWNTTKMKLDFFTYSSLRFYSV